MSNSVSKKQVERMAFELLHAVNSDQQHWWRAATLREISAQVQDAGSEGRVCLICDKAEFWRGPGY